MHDNPIGGEHRRGTPLAEDIEAEAAVLREVFSFGHPVTLEELVRHFGALNPASAACGQRDSIERAVRELVAGGLLSHSADDLILPTRPAHKFAELAEFP